MPLPVQEAPASAQPKPLFSDVDVDTGDMDAGGVSFPQMHGRTLVSDEDGFDTLAAIAADFHVNFGDQRAGRIKDFELATLSLALHFLGNAMGAENDVTVIGDLAEFVDKYSALLLEIIDHVTVMHDFMTDIDWGTKESYRAFDNFDGAVHSGAKSAGIGKQNFH